MFTDWDLGHELVGVPGGQAYSAFLDGDSREQHFHILEIFILSSVKKKLSAAILVFVHDGKMTR